MKLSLQSKFVALTLCVIILCTLVMGGAGISSAGKVLDQNAAKTMNMMCMGQANELNTFFEKIRISVDTVALYAENQLENIKRLGDQYYRESYTNDIHELFEEISKNTEGILAYFVRYNPDYAPPTSGIFYSKKNLNGGFEYVEPTDLSLYQPEDKEVEWYYTPVENGEGTWIMPYWNSTLKVDMISYVVPVYLKGNLVGVVGMDIEFDKVQEMVSQVSVYDTGYGFLSDENGIIIYHNSLERGTNMSEIDAGLVKVVEQLKGESSGDSTYDYIYGGVRKELAFLTLINDMKLVITVPNSEIEMEKKQLEITIFVAACIIGFVFITLATVFVKQMTRPVTELTLAAQRMEAGDMDVELHCHTGDELEVLTESYKKMAKELKRNLDYINSLAYVDALTGVKNQTAYQEMIRHLQPEIKDGSAEFAVVVLDVNGLKAVNDEYGHEQGDLLIRNGCRLICNVFTHSPVFRIGGDEFLVLLQKDDYKNREGLMEALVLAMGDVWMNGKEPWDRVSVAKGMACYDPKVDREFNQVFQRADKAMYENKAAMKAKLGVSSRI